MANFDDLLNDLNKLNDYVTENVRDALKYAAINVVNTARTIGSYTDRTGSLRASIGYGSVEDGSVVEDHVPRPYRCQGRLYNTNRT